MKKLICLVLLALLAPMTVFAADEDYQEARYTGYFMAYGNPVGSADQPVEIVVVREKDRVWVNGWSAFPREIPERKSDREGESPFSLLAGKLHGIHRDNLKQGMNPEESRRQVVAMLRDSPLIRSMSFTASDGKKLPKNRCRVWPVDEEYSVDFIFEDELPKEYSEAEKYEHRLKIAKGIFKRICKKTTENGMFWMTSSGVRSWTQNELESPEFKQAMEQALDPAQDLTPESWGFGRPFGLSVAQQLRDPLPESRRRR